MASSTYTQQDLLELSGWSPEHYAHVSRGGVALPDGVLMTTTAARRLGAQLLRAADEYDEIWDDGYNAGTNSRQEEINELLKTIRAVHKLFVGTPPSKPSFTEYSELRSRVLHHLRHDPQHAAP